MRFTPRASAYRANRPLSANDNSAWLVLLNDGEVCKPFTGTRPVIDNLVAAYGCSANAAGRRSVLLGDLDNSGPVRVAASLEWGSEWKVNSVQAMLLKTVRR